MRLFDAEAGATAESATINVPRRDRETYRVWQVNFSANGNVVVKGRNAPDLNWVTLHTFAHTAGADQAESIVAMADMKASIDSNTGVVTVDADTF